MVNFIIVALYVFVGLVLLIWICNEASERKGANVLVAFLFTTFFTPVAGLLYLMLFPRNVAEQKQLRIQTEPVSHAVKGNREGSSVQTQNATSYVVNYENSKSEGENIEIGEFVIDIATGARMLVADIDKNGNYKCIHSQTHRLLGVFTANQISKAKKS